MSKRLAKDEDSSPRAILTLRKVRSLVIVNMTLFSVSGSEHRLCVVSREISGWRADRKQSLARVF